MMHLKPMLFVTWYIYKCVMFNFFFLFFTQFKHQTSTLNLLKSPTKPLLCSAATSQMPACPVRAPTGLLMAKSLKAPKRMATHITLPTSKQKKKSIHVPCRQVCPAGLAEYYAVYHMLVKRETFSNRSLLWARHI